MLGQNFGARINSRELCQDAILMTSSYRQNCLWPALLADRGFTSESVALYQAQLANPAISKGKNQLDPFDVEMTRVIANVRTHVERVIGLFRQK